MYVSRKRGQYNYTRAEIMGIAEEIAEELREIEEGEVTTTLSQAEELGFTELTNDELFLLHDFVLYQAKSNKIKLDMTSDDDEIGGLPYRYEYEVFNKKAQIKCPHCGSFHTVRVIYDNEWIDERVLKKVAEGKVTLGGEKVFTTSPSGSSMDLCPKRYCRDCKKAFDKPSVLFNRKKGFWEPYMFCVKSVRFMDGGYFGGTKEVIIKENDKGALVTINEYPMSYMNDEPNERQITYNAWSNITVKLYSELYLHEWKKRYEDPNVLDGEQWELEIKLTDGRRRYYCGSNEFPPYWKELKKLFKPYVKI